MHEKSRQTVYTAPACAYDGFMLKHALTVTGLLLATAAPSAFAQDMPASAPQQNYLISYGIAGVAFVAVIALSVMSAKRTHQD